MVDEQLHLRLRPHNLSLPWPSYNVFGYNGKPCMLNPFTVGPKAFRNGNRGLLDLHEHSVSFNLLLVLLWN